MKGDFTRVTFNPAKQYTGVRMQQGRVQLDADWNEQLDITAHRERVEAVDVIGACGVPKQGGGFLIGLTPTNSDLTISPGRIYVDGILVEWQPTAIAVNLVDATTLLLSQLSADGRPFAEGDWLEVLHDGGVVQTQIDTLDPLTRVITVSPPLPVIGGDVRARWLATFLTQPFLPGVEVPDESGSYLIYLDIWERHVTALEDPNIREIALGGPDTTTRTQIVWQVRLLYLDESNGTITCDTVPDDWQLRLPQSGGRLRARTQPEDIPTDPCLTPTGGGYRLLENQLYRVEIHRIDEDGTPTFKWSRDNGSVVTAWTDQIGDNLRVSSLGRDAVLGFYAQTFAELTDDTHELLNEHGTLVRVTPSSSEDNTLTIDTTLTIIGSTTFADFPVNPKLRRWDSPGEITVEQPADNDGYIALEGGVEVRFELDAPYQPGNYWLIPARTAVGEQGGDILWEYDAGDPNVPLALPPLGVRHHYCLLAVGTTPNLIEDCRPDFPSLTTICAEDVCFDNTTCDLPDAKTVQDVLDYLCQGSDLRFHNKHLHGWGIVCGLQVVCEDGAVVRVRSGYAIDCEGRDLRVRDDVLLNIPDLAVQSGLNPPGEGIEHYHLRIDSAASNGVRFTLEPPSGTKPNPLQDILEGTLLLDFIQNCIQPLIDAAQDILSAETGIDAGLVTPREQRLISLINLVVQLVQRTYGQRVYLSRKEHDILQRIYDEIAATLRSETFCMLLDTLDPIPDYPFDQVQQDTVFGRGYHRRIRVNPPGTVGYTVGLNNQIHVYDLIARRLVNVLDFPSSGGLVVQDVALSSDGERFYAIATSATDTYFVPGAVSGFDVQWDAVVQFPNVRLVTLEFFSSGADNPLGQSFGDMLIAVGKGTGIYRIARQRQTGMNFALQQMFACVAVGHLQVDASFPMIVATASQQNNPNVYDSLAIYNPQSPTGSTFQLRALNSFTDGDPLFGQDGILLAFSREQEIASLIVEIDSFQGNTNRHAMLLNFDGLTPFLNAVVDLTEPSEARFLYNPTTGFVVVAYEDSFRLGLLDVRESALRTEFTHPVQISPVSMAYSGELGQVYVLNAVSNTITTIDANAFSPQAAFDPALHIDMPTLEQYRRDLFAAYLSLAGAIAQQVKDCFCDLLLVNCPECDEDDVVYLGEITVLNGQVRKVCNFSKRQQVKTFPKVSYWLSLLPIEGLIDYAVEQVCCLVIPDLMDRFQSRFSMDMRGGVMRESVVSMQRYSPQTLLQSLIQRFRPVTMMASDAVRGVRVQASRADMPPAVMSEYQVINRPVEAAKAELESNNVAVSVQPYDPARGMMNITNYLGAMGRVAPGSRVTLFSEGGTVKGVSVQPAAEAAPPAPPPAETEMLRGEIATLRAEMVQMQRTNADMLLQRDQQIAALQTQLSRSLPAQETIAALQERDARINALFESMTALRSQIERDTPSDAPPKPARRPRGSGGTGSTGGDPEGGRE
jgi:hypothetical protein